MKNSIFKSFRFEIVLYSLLSLIYTLIAIGILHMARRLVLWQKDIKLSGISIVLYGAFTLMTGVILFIIFFLLLTKKFIRYIREISEGINQISQGNLDNRIIIPNEDEFAFLADKLNLMADNIKEIMENERRIENSKNELITSVAHDLRTPLTSIIGYLDLVSKQELDQETRDRYINIAYNKSKRLEKLIEDLFTYTKFNCGEVKANITEVDMVKLINQLLDEFYPSFAENQLEYEFVTKCTHAAIMADGNLLARAFANLISNAIKYGAEGRKIRIELEKNQDGVLVAITNYGNIIPQEDLERIFQRFYRLELSRSCETGGSGLGLAIARSIINMHNGNIYVKSDENGTVFNIELRNNPDIEN